eukprot:TRINITY_DN11825_c0_g1_i1.p1 TRINITY_DN11825_c0_g1~~TRINITY_DN11825_c0_g1_i1.p1  ORF type:complete len:571 (-),score=143.49 TRINITY_DN11825_c0_g1_i1:162-1874(-)
MCIRDRSTQSTWGGKHRHTRDRLFISVTEHKAEWGGKKDPLRVPFNRLPFNCCALSLLPFENPVCTKEGVVFEMLNIIPYVKKYKKNPVTGEPMRMSDLIKLNFHKNAQGEYHDPISFKVFTDHTNIVAIRTSGNVYSAETIDSLNRKPHNLHDLMTGEEFKLSDIITIQDPKNLEQRMVTKFDYVQKKIDVDALRKTKDEVPEEKINLTGISKKVVEEMKAKQQEKDRQKIAKEEEEKKVEDQPRKRVKIEAETEKDLEEEVTPIDFVRDRLEKGDLRHSRYTSGEVASSFTSTLVSLNYENPLRKLTEEEVRKLYYDIIKAKQQKGYVQMITTVGAINLELFANFVPRTCENFIELCERKYYNNTKFHRFIPQFIIQGGDPTGTGAGGQSVWGKPFEDEFHPKLNHNQEGMLSMANSGKNTNKSQFFITLGAAKSLNGVHSVFGQVVGDGRIIDLFNEMQADEYDRPKGEVMILDTIVHVNPFREAIKEIRKKEFEAKRKAELEKVMISKESERWINNPATQLGKASLPTPTPPTNTSSGPTLPVPPVKATLPPPSNSKPTKFSFSNW